MFAEAVEMLEKPAFLKRKSGKRGFL